MAGFSRRTLGAWASFLVFLGTGCGAASVSVDAPRENTGQFEQFEFVQNNQGTLQACGSDGVCRDIPNPLGCIRLVLEIDLNTGGACQTCYDGSDTEVFSGCDGSTAWCDLLTGPEPDCLVCYYQQSFVFHNSCTPIEGTPPPPSNDGVTMTVSASGDDGNVPSNVLDDNLSTRWSAQGSGQYLDIRLSDVRDVTSVEVAFSQGTQRVQFFQLQSFVESGALTPAVDFQSSGASNAMQTFAFSSPRSTGIRLTGLGNSANAWNSITEVRLTLAAASQQGPSIPADTPPSATASLIPIPAVNSNGGVYFATVQALENALAALDSNWNSTMQGWGLATTGVEPVLGLAAGQHGDLNWADYGPYPERVTVRGAGPYGRDSYVPTAGTRVRRLLWRNCQDLRLMGVVAEPASVTTTYNAQNHRMTNCQRVEWVRNGIYGDVARTQAALATTPNAGAQVLIDPNGSSDSKVTQNALIGSRECVIGKGPNAVANNIEFRGNVVAQNHNDLIKFNKSQTDDWVVADNLAFGKGRNSGAQHRDFIQILGTDATGYARDWVIEGNWIQSRTAWGADTYLAKQAFYWGGGSAHSNATIPTRLFRIV
ncbi:MAG: discoidin domain-containing protein, partial [Myxococcota bacterium]